MQLKRGAAQLAGCGRACPQTGRRRMCAAPHCTSCAALTAGLCALLGAGPGPRPAGGRISGEEAVRARQQLLSEYYRRTGPAKVQDARAHIVSLLEAGRAPACPL